MRLILLPFLLIACGDNRAAPDAHVGPRFDGGVDSPVDSETDGPPANGPVNLTNITPAGGNVIQRADFVTPLFFNPDSSAVAVVANYASTGGVSSRFDAYLAPLDGSGTHRVTNAATCTTAASATCDVELLAWSADGTSLFAEGDLAVNNQFEVFKLDPAMTDQAPVVALDVAATTTAVINLLTVPSGGGATRVWAVGDFATDSKRQAGSFAADATLPATPATVPAGSNELFDGTNSTANVFDARGSKTAFVSDLTVASRFDLYVANADGSSPVMVQQGSIGIEITSVSLSPDGTKVAFLMDSLLINNGFDLHVVPTTGGTAKQLSPTRNVLAPTPALLNVFFQFEWSADSKLIAFSADLTEDKFDQGYVVDTTQTVPIAVELLTRNDIGPQASGAQGIRGKLVFDADNNIYFRARVDSGSTNFKLFRSTPTGTKVVLDLPLRTDLTVPDVGSFGISPDGQTLVFSSDAPIGSAYNLFAQPIE